MLFGASVNANDLQQLLLATLLHRALTSYQASVILAQRGLPQEAQVMLRTLLEVTFKIVAIAKDSAVGRAFVQEDELHRRKFLNKFKLLNPLLQDPATLSVLESLQSAIAQRIKDADVKELKTQWFAKKAGLSDFYNSAYAVLSDSVHANVRTLERALNVDDSGNLLSLNYGFSDNDFDIHLLTAAEALIFCLRAVFSVIDVPTAEEIHAIHEEFNSLHASVTGET